VQGDKQSGAEQRKSGDISSMSMVMLKKKPR
jgi:hypothetical protein